MLLVFKYMVKPQRQWHKINLVSFKQRKRPNRGKAGVLLGRVRFKKKFFYPNVSYKNLSWEHTVHRGHRENANAFKGTHTNSSLVPGVLQFANSYLLTECPLSQQVLCTWVVVQEKTRNRPKLLGEPECSRLFLGDSGAHSLKHRSDHLYFEGSQRPTPLPKLPLSSPARPLLSSTYSL